MSRLEPNSKAEGPATTGRSAEAQKKGEAQLLLFQFRFSFISVLIFLNSKHSKFRSLTIELTIQFCRLLKNYFPRA